MTDKIITAPASHSEELLTAVERTLAAHDLRLKPGQTLENVIEAFSSAGISVKPQFGGLTAEQHNMPIHVAQAVEGLASTQADRFFPRDPSGVTAKDQLDMKGKLELLRQPGGLETWEALPASAPKETLVVLDQRRLTKSQYLSLDRKTRSDLSGQWGPDVISQILNRK